MEGNRSPDGLEMTDDRRPPVRGFAWRRRLLILMILIPTVGFGVAWGIRTLLYVRSHESTDNAQVDADIVPVLAKVGGYVIVIPISENESVSENDLLLRLEPEEFEVKLAQAVATLRAAEVAAGEQARSLVSGATGQRDALQADLGGATAGVGSAARDLERITGLAEKQIVSQQRLDATKLAVETAEARVAALKEREAAAGAGVESALAGADLAAARLDAARAAVHSAEIQLGHTVVTAPVRGIVSRKSVVLGQLVQPGQPLMAIVDPDAVWLTANFKETQLEGIRLDASVDFSVDAYPSCEGRGVVESFAAATGSQFALLPPNNATGNFTKVVQRLPVRIRVVEGCGADRPLRPGMSVEAHVSTG